MTVVDLIFFVLATAGLTNLIVDGSIFSPIRDFLKKILPSYVYSLFECHQCCGTWCGFVCGAALLGTTPSIILCAGFSGGFIAVLAVNILNYLESDLK